MSLYALFDPQTEYKEQNALRVIQRCLKYLSIFCTNMKISTSPKNWIILEKLWCLSETSSYSPLPCLISCSPPPSPSPCSMRSLRSKYLCSRSAIQCSPSMLIYSSQARVFAKYQNIQLGTHLFHLFSSRRLGLFPIRFSRAGLSDCKTFLLHCNSPCWHINKGLSIMAKNIPFTVP